MPVCVRRMSDGTLAPSEVWCQRSVNAGVGPALAPTPAGLSRLAQPAVHGEVAQLLRICRQRHARRGFLGQFAAVRPHSVSAELELQVQMAFGLVADNAQRYDEVLPTQVRPGSDGE